MTSRRPVPPDLRAEAVRLATQVGQGEAARRTGLARPSISRWAKEAGVDTANASMTRNREAVLAAAERRKKLLAEANERAVQLLTVARDAALQKTVEIIQAGGDVTVHELVGVWTRAGHDLALLEGQATERVDMTVEARAEIIHASLEAYLQGHLDASSTIDVPEHQNSLAGPQAAL